MDINVSPELEELDVKLVVDIVLIDVVVFFPLIFDEELVVNGNETGGEVDCDVVVFVNFLPTSPFDDIFAIDGMSNERQAS